METTAGAVLGEADDGEGTDPIVRATIPQGINEVIVSVSDLIRGGGVNYGYRLQAREPKPGFHLEIRSGRINVPTTGMAIVKVQVVREGFNDAIQLKIPASLYGLKASAGLIPAGAGEGFLQLSAIPGAAPAECRWKFGARLARQLSQWNAGPCSQATVRQIRSSILTT